eukprot:5839021-Pyramimonas_sp.AAC.1
MFLLWPRPGDGSLARRLVAWHLSGMLIGCMPAERERVRAAAQLGGHHGDRRHAQARRRGGRRRHRHV